MTLFLVDLRQVRAEQPKTLEVTPVRTMFNYATNSLVYNGLRVPADHIIGTVDEVSGTSLVSSPDRRQPGCATPARRRLHEVRAADMMRYEAARLVDAGMPCGAEANMAKHLASEASWAAANAALDTHGGYGFVDKYDLERKSRETRMFQVAPINNNLIKAFIATKVLGLPRSY